MHTSTAFTPSDLFALNIHSNRLFMQTTKQLKDDLFGGGGAQLPLVSFHSPIPRG